MLLFTLSYLLSVRPVGVQHGGFSLLPARVPERPLAGRPHPHPGGGRNLVHLRVGRVDAGRELHRLHLRDLGMHL